MIDHNLNMNMVFRRYVFAHDFVNFLDLQMLLDKIYRYMAFRQYAFEHEPKNYNLLFC